jgi:hypothetical protein
VIVDTGEQLLDVDDDLEENNVDLAAERILEQQQQQNEEFPIPINETAAANPDADLLQAYFEDESATDVTVSVGADKSNKPSILEIEIGERLKAIRLKDRKGRMTWPNLVRHVASLLNFPQCDTTTMLQMFKAAEKEITSSGTKLSELPATGQGLMAPPKAQLKAARLKYMLV